LSSTLFRNPMKNWYLPSRDDHQLRRRRTNDLVAIIEYLGFAEADGFAGLDAFSLSPENSLRQRLQIRDTQVDGGGIGSGIDRGNRRHSTGRIDNGRQNSPVDNPAFLHQSFVDFTFEHCS